MGEPVTEEMLVRIEGCGYPTLEELMLVAEVRRLRAALTQASRTHAEGWTSGYDNGTAEGYARAERDVVVWLRRPYMSEVVGFEVGDGGRIEVAGEVEQGAHRGAAKEGT